MVDWDHLEWGYEGSEYADNQHLGCSRTAAKAMVMPPYAFWLLVCTIEKKKKEQEEGSLALTHPHLESEARVRDYEKAKCECIQVFLMRDFAPSLVVFTTLFFTSFLITQPV